MSDETIKIVWREPLVVREEQEALIPEKYLDLTDNDDIPVLFSANAGVAKTSSIINYTHKKGYPLFIQECSSDMLATDLVGKWTIKGTETVYMAGECTSALHYSCMLKEQFDQKYGNIEGDEREKALEKFPKVYLLLDEINLLPPIVMKGLGSLFDARKYLNTDGPRIMGEREFLRVVGTMNAESMSAGFSLDPAVRSRFLILKIKVTEILTKLQSEHQLSQDIIDLITQTDALFSIREVEQLSVLKTKGVAMEEGLRLILQKYEEEDLKTVKNALAALGIKVS